MSNLRFNDPIHFFFDSPNQYLGNEESNIDMIPAIIHAFMPIAA